MLFNNIDKNTKLEILEENIPDYEKDVYGLLIKLGINPATFDEDTFEEEDPSVDENDLTTVAFRKRLKEAIDALKIINEEISNLEI
jgi:hypothetical protein